MLFGSEISKSATGTTCSLCENTEYCDLAIFERIGSTTACLPLGLHCIVRTVFSHSHELKTRILQLYPITSAFPKTRTSRKDVARTSLRNARTPTLLARFSAYIYPPSPATLLFPQVTSSLTKKIYDGENVIEVEEFDFYLMSLLVSVLETVLFAIWWT